MRSRRLAEYITIMEKESLSNKGKTMDMRENRLASVENRTTYVAPQMDIISIEYKGNILDPSLFVVEECSNDDPECDD